MLNLVKGCSVARQELLEEGYRFSGENHITANVNAEKIQEVVQHFITDHNELLFFILEIPVNIERENPTTPGVLVELHKDVYYIDGCSSDVCLTILNQYGELLVNDGISSFGFGGHESHDEIMVGKYNTVMIYGRSTARFEILLASHGITLRKNLITSWETFTSDSPGNSERYEVDGVTVFDLPEKLKELNIYLAETRVD